MIIIAFSKKTSKFLPKLFCKNFRHCAPIIKQGKHYALYQFIKSHRIEKIIITKSGINSLKRNSWFFVKTYKKVPEHINKINAISCVIFTKKVIGLKNIFIQTPDALYDKIKRP